MFYHLVMKKDNETTHPTITYIESVCKKASDEGFKLHIGHGGYIWEDKTGEQFGEAWSLDAPTLMLEACIGIEKKQNWNLLTDSV